MGKHDDTIESFLLRQKRKNLSPTPATPATVRSTSSTQRIDPSKETNTIIETTFSALGGGVIGALLALGCLLGIPALLLFLWTASTTDNSNPDPQYSERITYSKPAVGTNNILSISQIRWCIREGIQIDTLRDYISTNIGHEKFNNIVNNYNSRCANYRYSIGTLSRAEREVEAMRNQIVAAAIQEAKKENHTLPNNYSAAYPGTVNNSSFKKTNSATIRARGNTYSPTKSRSTNSSLKKQSVQHIMTAQKYLTQLGYNPGPVDGQAGNKTKYAVKAFQQSEGLLQDGWIDQDLLTSLERKVEEKRLWQSAPTKSQPVKYKAVSIQKQPSKNKIITKSDLSKILKKLQR